MPGASLAGAGVPRDTSHSGEPEAGEVAPLNLRFDSQNLEPLRGSVPISVSGRPRRCNKEGATRRR